MLQRLWDRFASGVNLVVGIAIAGMFFYGFASLVIYLIGSVARL